MIVVVAPILIGVLYVFLVSVLREPARRRFNAVMVAGAGAAYLSGGGFGAWEFVFTAAMTYCAYRGLDSYVWTGVAWLLHTAWDVLHYLRGVPIIPFASHSSLGCAICDPVIAIWCLRGGPSPPAIIKSWFSRRREGTLLARISSWAPHRIGRARTDPARRVFGPLRRVIAGRRLMPKL